MKKFLNIEQSAHLLNLGVPKEYATYLYCEDSRWASEAHEMLTMAGYWKRQDRLTIFESDKPIFSIGDLMNFIDKKFNLNLEQVLEKMNFNMYCSQIEDDTEIIDYLFNFIIKNL